MLPSEDTGYLNQLSQDQHPEYLWIGCSGSWVPAVQVIDQPPSQIFVHYNIVNVVVDSDVKHLSL